VPTHRGMARLIRPGWLWLYTKMVYPRTVTHPSTNRARRRATMVIETNALPPSQAATRQSSKITPKLLSSWQLSRSTCDSSSVPYRVQLHKYICHSAWHHNLTRTKCVRKLNVTTTSSMQHLNESLTHALYLYYSSVHSFIYLLIRTRQQRNN